MNPSTVHPPARAPRTQHRPGAGPSPRALADGPPTWAWLAAGAMMTVLTGPRWGAAALAWLAPVPYLLAARRARRWRHWLVLAAVPLCALPLQLLSIVTPPVPPLAILGFGIPVALAWTAALALGEFLRRRAGEGVALFGYAASVSVLDALLYAQTELGAWAATANSQVAALGLMQVVSVVGMAGLGFLMAWFAALVAMLLAAPAAANRVRHALALGAVLGAVLVFGSVRLDRDNAGGRSVTVAAVVTDLGIGPAGIPPAAALTANTDALFERTRLAAARGARVVVWPEIGALVERSDETALIDRARTQARELGVDLIVGYGVIRSRAPMLLDDRYAFVTSEGEVAEVYDKHHPVPGEPIVGGDAPIRVIERPYARVAGAVCYDYDFPALAREHARLGAELVLVPASDWRGIDPVHTLMARTRAIENGFSLVRSVRWGASAAFDPYGRVRGWMQSTEANDRVMVASVPIGRVQTPYTWMGESFALFAAAVLTGALAWSAWRRRAPPTRLQHSRP